MLASGLTDAGFRANRHWWTLHISLYGTQAQYREPFPYESPHLLYSSVLLIDSLLATIGLKIV